MWRSAFMVCLWAAAGPVLAVLPKEGVPLRDAFESSLSGLDSERVERVRQLGEEYLAGLRKLRTELEAAGRLRPLVAAHDELMRFSKTPEPGNPDPDSIELATLQGTYAMRVRQVQYSNDVEVVRLAERYVQALAELRDGLSRAGAADAVKGVDEERDRLLSLGRLRAALRSSMLKPPVPVDGDGVYTPGATNSVSQGRSRSLRLYRLSSEDVAKVMAFNMTLSLVEDSSRLRVREATSGMTITRSEEGPVIYTPRIAITARNAEVPPDSDLEITYYSQSLTDSGYRKESSETLPMPRVARGDTATLEGRGLSLWRSTSITHTGRGPDARSHSGSELFGIVITVRDSQGAVLLKRFTPQQLAKDLEPGAP